MSCSFTVQVPAQLDLFRNLTRTKAYKNDFHKRTRRESCENCTFQHSVRSYRRWQEPSIAKNCSPSSSSSAGGLQHEPFDEGSARILCPKVTRHEPKLHESSARISCGSPQRPSCSHQLPQSSAGYDCVINATVREGRVWLPKQHHRLESPRSRGVSAPRVCRPADYLPSGTVGQWPPATGQWWNERRGGDPKTDLATQRGGDPKTDQRKEELSKQLGCEGKGP